MDPTAIALVTLCSLGCCAAMGGLIAYRKKRRPTEGVVLGLLLGPIGVAVEGRLPSVPRPEVDEKAWHSFRSVAAYQPTPPRRPRTGPPS